MNEYLPVWIVGGIIGVFTVVFLLAYYALRKVKEDPELTGICLTGRLSGGFALCETLLEEFYPGIFHYDPFHRVRSGIASDRGEDSGADQKRF